MDTTKELTHIGLCAGYGGIELGLKRVLPTLRTIALCEIEAFACANLVAKMEAGLMDPAPIWTNLKTFPWAEFRDKVDILSGGYPCQPFSAAGKRLGGEDPRHLWPFISSGIQILRPRLCFFENVEGHISLGLREVIADLESLGYETAWGIFSAAECGAPHQRKRVFIMANRNDTGSQGRKWLGQTGAQRASGGHPAKCGGAMAVASSIGGAAGLSGSLTRHERITGVADNCGSKDMWPSRPGQPQHAWEPPRVVGNATSQRLEGGQQSSSAWTATKTTSTTNGGRKPESPMGGDTDGAASGLDHAKLSVSCDNRTDELRLLGNGVVPATAAIAFRTLLKELTQ